MKRLQSILAAFSLMVPVAAHGDEPSRDWNKDVLRLFLLEERDQALQKLLKEARYPQEPAYTEDHAGKIKEVVVCPQSNGQPLVTVFAGSDYDSEDVSPHSGHFIVIRNDGMILPFYYGANSLDGYFRDLNGDGVMDYIDSWGIGHGEGTVTGVTGLHLVPITEAFSATLVVYWQEDVYEWRLHQPDLDRIPTIQIGLEKEGSFEPIAEFRWSREKKEWQGPEGSPEQKFMRVRGDPKAVARKLIEAEEAEQGGADQPATAPESKLEGEENPKPESQVRSR